MAMPEVARFRENVASLCAERGEVQTVADKAGITRVFLSRIIHGHATPTLEVAAKIADALGKPLGKLLSPARQKNIRQSA